MADVQEIEIAKIHWGTRIRQSFTKIADLARSIEERGLLHPIVLNTDLTLIVGGRRVRAYEHLGRTTIPALITDAFQDIRQALYAERDENVEREPLTPSEQVAQAAAIEPYERQEAQERLRHSPGRPPTTGTPEKKPRKSFPRFSATQDDTKRSKARTAKAVGMSRPSLEKAQEVVHAATEAPETYGDLVTKMDTTGKVDGAHRELRKRKHIAARRARETTTAPFDGMYDVLVIDPPWPVAMQGRTARPDQLGLAYSTMTIEQIQALALPMATDCHVWLWTTQRFLPDAFRCLDTWHLHYVCCFVWLKPGGMQPMDLPQFNCEFALYARRGSPAFVDTKDFATGFTAPRMEHSEKPPCFYAMVQRVTAGRRLDVFNRRPIQGFERWGYEAKELEP